MKRRRLTDGVTTFERIEVTLPSRRQSRKLNADDASAIVESMRANTPRGRIASLRTLIEGCTPAPSIDLHTNAIAAILRDLQPLASGRAASSAELDALGKAEAHWRDVLVIRDALPLAAHGISLAARAERDRRRKVKEIKAVNDQRALDLKPAHDEEAAAAAAKWKANPRLSAIGVARMIAPDNVDVVRQRIAPLKPPKKES